VTEIQVPDPHSLAPFLARLKAHSRAAAWTAAVILVVIAGFQIYWGVGGAWGLGESAATSSTAAHIGSVLIGLVALAAACVLLVRVGYWRGHVPITAVRLTRMVALVSLGGALAEFARGGFASGTINLIVALLAFVVAGCDLPASRLRGTAPTPSSSPRRVVHP
jgi:hypothetical protein